VVIPIGSNEQHGPTGLLGTDWLCPEIIGHEAQGRSEMLVGRPSTSAWPTPLAFPVSISLRPST